MSPDTGSGRGCLRTVQRVERQAREYAARCRVDVRQQWVTNFERRVQVTAKSAETKLAPTAELTPDIERQLSPRQPISRQTVIGGEHIKVGLTGFEPWRDEKPGIEAQRLIELGSQKRLSTELQVRSPLCAEAVDGRPGQTSGHVERRGTLKIVLQRHAKLQIVVAERTPCANKLHAGSPIVVHQPITHSIVNMQAIQRSGVCLKPG